MTDVSTSLLWKLDALLESAIRRDRTDLGNLQLLDPANGVLTIVAQRGFGPGFLEHFRTVGGDDTSACGRALRSCAPIAVVDVQQDPAFHGHREVMEIAGVRAVKSLPIVASDGRVLGMLSTHFRQPQPIDVSTIREFADRAAALIQDGDNGNAAGSRSR